jgi:hypothetical protein
LEVAEGGRRNVFSLKLPQTDYLLKSLNTKTEQKYEYEKNVLLESFEQATLGVEILKLESKFC